MPFEIPKTNYSGKIKTVTLGKGEKAVTVGGETAYPFYLFEGEMPNLPRIAMEVYDTPPKDWPAAALEPFKDVVNDPVAWAQKCVKSYSAEMICVQLASTDPNGENRPADKAAELKRDGVVQAQPFPQGGPVRNRRLLADHVVYRVPHIVG